MFDYCVLYIKEPVMCTIKNAKYQYRLLSHVMPPRRATREQPTPAVVLSAPDEEQTMSLDVAKRLNYKIASRF